MNVLSSAFCYFCPVSVDAFILGKMQDGNMENNQTKGNLLSLYRWFERSPLFYSSFPLGGFICQLLCLCCFSYVRQGLSNTSHFLSVSKSRTISILKGVCSLAVFAFWLFIIWTKLSRGVVIFQIMVKINEPMQISTT